MKKLMMLIICGLISLVAAVTVFADGALGVQVMKISPQDERAVIRAVDGKTQVIRPGDKLFNGTVIEIAEGRVVLEERQGNDIETIIIRLKDGKQLVERVRKSPPSKLHQDMKAVSSQLSATGKSKGQKSSIN